MKRVEITPSRIGRNQLDQQVVEFIADNNPVEIEHDIHTGNPTVYVEVPSHPVLMTVGFVAALAVGVYGGAWGQRAFNESTESFAAQKSMHPTVAATLSPSTEAPTPAVSETASEEASSSPTNEPTATTSPTPSKTMKNQIVFLDPWLSGKKISKIDPVTLLKDVIPHETPANEENYAVATMTKQILEDAGYTVVLSKSSANDSKSSRERVDEAREANAEIAVTIQVDHGVSPENLEAVFAQKENQYREQDAGNDETIRTTFRGKETACISQAYATLIQGARKTSQGMNVENTVHKFNEASPKGNISLTQLFADKYNMPWVDNRMGALVGGNADTKLSTAMLKNYAEGIAKGVDEAMQQQADIKSDCGV